MGLGQRLEKRVAKNKGEKIDIVTEGGQERKSKHKLQCGKENVIRHGVRQLNFKMLFCSGCVKYLAAGNCRSYGMVFIYVTMI